MKKGFIYLFLLFILACSSREDFPPANDTNEIEVSFLPASSSLNQPGGNPSIEEKIETVDILVFDKNQQFRYYRPAWKTKLEYKSTLKIEEDVMLHFFINCRDLIPSSLKEGTAHVGKGPDEILDLLTDRNPARLTGGETPLPMWGVVKKVSISTNTFNDLGEIGVLRAVALVNVAVEVKEDKFELSGAALFHAPSMGYPGHLAVNQDVTAEEEKASIPADASFDLTLRYNKSVNNNSILSGLFSYENDNRITPTRLIIGGYYENSKEPTFYPLDFREGKQKKPLLRNSKYDFTIISVSGEGYASEAEALQASSVNMEYEVIQWDETNDNEIGIDGPLYFSLSTRQVDLFNRVGSYRRINVLTNMDTHQISMDFKERNIVSGYGQEEDDCIKNDLFEARFIRDTNNKLTHLVIKALKTYDPNYNSDFLLIQAGRIWLSIRIRQLPEDDSAWEDGGNFVVDGGEVTTGSSK